MTVDNGTNRTIFVVAAALFLRLYAAQMYLMAADHRGDERKAEVATGNATLASEGTVYICEREDDIEVQYAFLCHQAEQIAKNPVQPVPGEKGDRGLSCVEEFGFVECRGPKGDKGDDGDPPPTEEVRSHLEDISPQLIQPVVLTWLERNPPPPISEASLEEQFTAFCAARNDCKGDTGNTGDKGDAGNDGDDGKDGRDGKNGVGIASMSCPEKNLMVIRLTDGQTFSFAIPCHTLR
jgi:hypothetical protein